MVEDNKNQQNVAIHVSLNYFLHILFIFYTFSIRFLLSLICEIYGANFTIKLYENTDDSYKGVAYVAKDETKEDFLLSLQQELSANNIPSENFQEIRIRNPENNTKIDQVPSELFALYPELDVLDMNLQITEVDASAFENAKELMIFSISGSKKLQKLPAGVFQVHDLPKLGYLGFENNALETIEDFTFVNLSSVTELVLNKNKLTKITRNTFAGLIGLKELELNENEIHTIESGAFADFQSLKKLYLNHNKLKAITVHLFDGLAAVTTLHIGSNEIEMIGNQLYTLNSLKEINLEDNPIGDIDLVKFATLPKLLVLNLNKTGVNLESVNISADYRSKSKLDTLNLANNNLISATSLELLGRLFPKTEELDLTGNEKLKEVNVYEERVREFLPKLDIFDL